MFAILQQNIVKIEIRDSAPDPCGILLNATPFLLLLAFWAFAMIYLRRQRQR
jgi:hypothetical protein